jgi:SAM-dependent methyltransferase
MDDADPRAVQAAYADADEPGAFFDLLASTDIARREAADAPWTGDVAFYRELAREHEPALEVGVGTGRVYLDLLAAGLDVDGIDRSAASLARLRGLARERGLVPSVWLADATCPGTMREYGLVYAPARVINHLPTPSMLRGAFAAARDCLRPGGRFAFNTFVPGFEVVAEQYGEKQEREFTVDGVPHREVSVTRLTDELEQVAHIERTLYRDGERVASRETPLALYPKRVLELALEAAGFSEWTLYGGFDREPPSADREMVWIAEP